MENSNNSEISYFDGSVGGYLGWSVLGWLISIVTYGIAYPWAFCMIQRYYINHSIVEGKRLHFDGTGGEMFRNWVKWVFLCIVTLGIYGFWLPVELEKWKLKHTGFLVS